MYINLFWIRQTSVNINDTCNTYNTRLPKLLFCINKSLQLEICKIIPLKSSFPFYFNNYYYNRFIL